LVEYIEIWSCTALQRSGYHFDEPPSIWCLAKKLAFACYIWFYSCIFRNLIAVTWVSSVTGDRLDAGVSVRQVRNTSIRRHV
jgi:hypothetical protein